MRPIGSKLFSFYPRTGPTEKFFRAALGFTPRPILEKWGKRGVDALRAATPIDTGETADLWRYEIKHEGKTWDLSFYNDHIVDRVVIAVVLQYGHLSRGGTFVSGIDYINPAMRPIFDGIRSDLDRELSKL